ncbi:MAG: thiol:disulfide interchange protein DsbA/DsbL [Halomonadaceae bacterium]|nr:MAG: thiol:disulfide interchange protein DsbA/DsbL [Halomonadaceae bacterium]
MRQLLTGLIMLSLLPFTAVANDFQEGTHYERLPSSVGTENRDKIEVAEVFWYGCPACHSMQPLITPWAETLAEDVALVHLPAALRGDWEVHAQAFYTARSLGVVDQVHSDLFQALAGERQRLNSKDQMARFFADRGVDEDEFRKAWGSFSVNSMMQRASSRIRGARVTGTPSLIVNGKYLVTVRGAGSQENMLAIADHLIEKERQQN